MAQDQNKYRNQKQYQNQNRNQKRECGWEAAEAYIYAIPKFTKKNSLQNTRRWYEKLGSPGGGARIIHVAGTNGKGSVCNYLSHLLKADGERVGMFVSPHLVSMNERIVVDGEIIDKECFLEAYALLRNVIDEELCQSGYEQGHPTFFEFLFLLAMLIFEKKETGTIILETGLGGRLDATNIFECPALTVITEIGLDHMQYLGETKEQIAWEKAGIIKRGVPLVFADQCPETTQVLRRRAKELHAPYTIVGREDHLIKNLSNKSIDFSYKSGYYDYITFTLPTNAVYQAQNAALALRGYETLMGGEWDVRRAADVLVKTRWAGRMEELLPDVYVDGAHNEDGVRAFLDTVRRMPGDKRNVLVFSAMKDKAYERMVRLLIESGLFARFVAVQMPEERCAPQEELRKIFSEYKGISVTYADTVTEGVAGSVRDKREDERVYIAGSLYLAGHVMTVLGRKLKDD